MSRPIVFGASYSVYVRIVRLALEEKRIAYELVPVDVFAPGGPPAEHLKRHPFGRIPAFEHEGFRLYEAGAITRYVDETFPDPPLLPARPRERARVHQMLSMLDSYAYRTLVWDLFVERVRAPQQGRVADEARIAAALPRARTCLRALTELTTHPVWLAGDALSLADLHAAPMIALLRLAPEGAQLLAEQPRLGAWWEAMAQRPSMTATRFPVELER